MPAPKVRWFVTVLIAMVILGVAAGLSLSRARDSATGAQRGADGVSPREVSEVPLPGPGASIPASMAAEPASGKPVSSARQPKTTRTASVRGPVIVTYHVTQKPTCPSGTDQARLDGQPVVLGWTVTGAKQTTLSVDGPGVYATYAAEDTATINFPCGGDPGGEQTHTYTLAVAGPEGTESKTLTVTARVNPSATT
ncbi:hypothetical protein [Actinoplanes derwentensis]|uniref:Uncharacterized protein n=1 Tax=Actinoplanes derwentensis TaxID=113562 RepID=A0A1H1Z240_9ACTN|nr:hypothetical protein [Actinoplanes derwentensis]GID81391.1 hypothetical protein Ade03nite_03150 [Actinoplanes derwentensis]SDT27683.1 hypothetical protein SAMN04489716_3099 [Actinoplanes derwentensis]